MQPPKPTELLALFNKFAGKEVCPPFAAMPDPTIEAMQKIANDNGLRLRVWFPGTVGTMELRGNRVNVHVEQGTDGKYRISNKFDIG